MEVSRRKLEEIGQRLAPLPYQTRIEVASPVGFLYDLASSLEQALMIVTTHAWRGTDRRLLGSVTERVISRVPCAILTLKSQRTMVREIEKSPEPLPNLAEVRGPELRQVPKSPDDFFFERLDRKLVAASRAAAQKEKEARHGRQTHVIELRSLLVPVDFSRRAEQAVVVGVALARRYGAKLILLHVLEERSGGRGRPLREARRREVARAQLEALRDRLVPVPCVCLVEGGSAAAVIVEQTERQEIDLVVMGSRGRRTVVGIPLGSTARVVVRRADSAVLILKGPNATELVRKTPKSS
ncbi:MAG: universal stress protein [Candidatus Xenobium sp.]